MLSSSSPVTAMTRSARWMPARSSTQSSLASPYWTACSSSCSTTRYRRRSCSSRVTSWPFSISSRARFQPTFPAPAMITYTAASSCQGGHRVLEHVDRHGRGTDRRQPLLAVPLGASGIEHAHDHALDAVAPARDLGDHQVRVVAVGADEDDLRLGDARLG